MTSIVTKLRKEAKASEELDATDSSIAVMREAANLIEEFVELLDSAGRELGVIAADLIRAEEGATWPIP